MSCFYPGDAYVQLGVRQKTERMTHMNNHEYRWKKKNEAEKKKMKRVKLCSDSDSSSMMHFFRSLWSPCCVLNSFHTVSKGIKEECPTTSIRRSSFRKLWCTYSECFFTFCSSIEDSYHISEFMLWSQKQIHFFHLFET